MKWFKSKDEKPAAPPTPLRPPSVEEQEAKLKERFREAVMGNGTKFRTLAYTRAGSPGATEWREAVCTEGAGWIVKRYSQIATPEKTLVNHETLTKDRYLNFYEAVESLAREYEFTQIKYGCAPCKDPSPESLGMAYVQTFAEAEGIAFDNAGIPHPTASDGTIVSEEPFPAEAYEKAKKAAQARAAKGVDAAPIIPVAAPQFAVSALPDAAKPKIYAGKGFSSAETMNRIPELNEMYGALCALREFTDKAQNGWFRQAEGYEPDYQNRLVCYAERLLNSNMLPTMRKNYAAAMTSLSARIPALKNDAKLTSDLAKSFDLAAMQTVLCYAAEALMLKGEERKTGFKYRDGYHYSFFLENRVPDYSPYKYTYGDNDYNRARGLIAECLKNTGHSDVTGDFALVTSLIAAKNGSSSSVPDEMDKVISWFRGTMKTLEASLAPPAGKPQP